MAAECVCEVPMHEDILLLKDVLDAGDHVPEEFPLQLLLQQIQLILDLAGDIAALHQTSGRFQAGQ